MASKREKDSSNTKWLKLDKPIKVDKWDGSALKNALDDGIRKIFTEKFGYIECHRLMDRRLAICSIAVGFALFALAWDYFRPFPQSRPVLIVCVVSYFIMMGILTLYTTFIEKGIFLEAHKKDLSGIDPSDVWLVSSQLKRYDDMYHITVVYKNGRTKRTRETRLSKSVACWFDENGTLLLDLLEPDITKLHNSLSSEKKEK